MMDDNRTLRQIGAPALPDDYMYKVVFISNYEVRVRIVDSESLAVAAEGVAAWHYTRTEAALQEAAKLAHDHWVCKSVIEQWSGWWLG